MNLWDTRQASGSAASSVKKKIGGWAAPPGIFDEPKIMLTNCCKKGPVEHPSWRLGPFGCVCVCLSAPPVKKKKSFLGPWQCWFYKAPYILGDDDIDNNENANNNNNNIKINNNTRLYSLCDALGANHNSVCIA